jgi:mannitol/fructose-specific phosphotransferase system IIA component
MADKVSRKQIWNKTVSEMTFDELVNWAAGMIIFGIAKGDKLHSIVWDILNQLSLSSWWKK